MLAADISDGFLRDFVEIVQRLLYFERHFRLGSLDLLLVRFDDLLFDLAEIAQVAAGAILGRGKSVVVVVFGWPLFRLLVVCTISFRQLIFLLIHHFRALFAVGGLQGSLPGLRVGGFAIWFL